MLFYVKNGSLPPGFAGAPAQRTGLNTKASGPLALQLCHFYGNYNYTKPGRNVQWKTNFF